jgi:hypothetical protein
VYPTTSTYQNNVFYNLTPTAGTFTNVIQTVSGSTTTYYTCAQAVALSGSTFGTFSSCTNADPQFTAASPGYWAAPSSFNFRPLVSSPAVGAGLPPQFPRFDLIGNKISETAPSLGSYAVTGVSGSGGTGISGKVTIGGNVVIQ